jgi:hypothetical protein
MNKIAALEAQLAGDPDAIAESERKLKAARTRSAWRKFYRPPGASAYFSCPHTGSAFAVQKLACWRENRSCPRDRWRWPTLLRRRR